MFLVGLLSWWYGEGLTNRVQIIKNRLASSADFFSIRLLASTLFAPFRQISAESINGSLPDQMRAFFDRLLSRVIGATVRSFMIVFGSFALLMQVIFGIIVMAIWLPAPLLPAVGLILASIGGVT